MYVRDMIGVMQPLATITNMLWGTTVNSIIVPLYLWDDEHLLLPN